MKLIFKQAVKIEGKIYSRGAHELLESELNKILLNQTYLKFCKLGLIIEEPKQVTLATESLMVKNQRLAEKFEAEAKKPVASQDKSPGEVIPKKIKKSK